MAKCCVRMLTLASLLSLAAAAPAASDADFCAGGETVPGRALMQMHAATSAAEATTAAPAALSGLVGGLQVEYFYFSSGLNAVSVMDGEVAALTTVVQDINIPSTGDFWPGLTQKDKFAAKWTGGLKITKPGTYTLETRSDDGSVVMVDGTVVVDNDGLHGMRTKTGDIVLGEGEHSLVVKFFENGGGAGIIFSYSGEDTDNVEMVVPASVLITPAGVQPPTTTTTTAIALSGNVGGLLAEYYYLNTALKSVSVIDGLVADLSRAEENIDIHDGGKALREAWPGLSQSDRFGAKWTGGLNIVEGGDYTVELISDDGTVLMLDGAVVINNDGEHSMRTKTADIHLNAGAHPLTVKFFENGGIAGVIFKYSGPDTGFEEMVVPSSALITPAGVDPPTTTTTTAIALSGMLGGLKVEYFYFSTGLKTVSVIDGVVADLTSVAETIDIASTGNLWPGLTQKDKFGAKWTGGLNITKPGTYTLETRSDDGSVVMVNGAVVVDNDGLHSMRTKTADIYLEAGAHPLVVKFFENGGGAGMIFRYSGPDTDGEEMVVPSSVLMTPAGVQPPTTTTTTAIALSENVGGLKVDYFYFSTGLNAVSVMDGVVPDHSTVVENINIASTGQAWPQVHQADKFGALWTGGLKITKPGTYTLETRSDDGSVVMVNGAVVVDNDGLHGMRTKTGDIVFDEAGTYPLAVRFFENGGGAGIIFSYSGPDTDDVEMVVPSSVLVTPAGFSPPGPYSCPADPIPNIVSDNDYCTIPEIHRTECGYYGISQAICEARGCCFRYKEGGPEIPECYCAKDLGSTTTTTKPYSCPEPAIQAIDSTQPYCSSQPEAVRVDCGWPYINKQLCEDRGCCWDDDNIQGGPEIPRCFCATSNVELLSTNATAVAK